MTDLKQLLNANKHEFIDIEPLLQKHFGHFPKDEQTKYRLNAQTEIRQMKENGLVLFKEGYFVVTNETPYKYSFIKCTDKFDKEQNKTASVQQIISVDKNYGQVINSNQSSFGDFRNDQKNTSNRNPQKNVRANNQNTLSKITYWIFEHIIVVIFVTLICAYLGWKFGWI